MKVPLPLRGDKGAARPVGLLAALVALIASATMTGHQAAGATAPPRTALTSSSSQSGGVGSDQASMNAFLSYSRPDSYKIHKSPDILVPMRDGYTLTCDLYQPALPDGSIAPGRFPGFVNSYEGYGRKNSQVGAIDHTDFAAKGYNVIWCNTRGSQGIADSSPAPHSQGPLNPWQPQEQQDNYDLIEWMAHQPWSTGQIGQVGMSYGGITTWLVAGRQRPPHLAAIIPVMGTTNIYKQFAYPGGIRTDKGDARGAWTQSCSVLIGEPTCSDRVTAEWAANPNYDLFWKQQTIDPADIKIPTLDIEGFRDFFSAEADDAYARMGSHSNFRLLIGPWDHSVPDSDPQAPLSKGVYLAWFDHWLRGDNSAPLPPKVTAYQMGGSAISAADGLLPATSAVGWQGLSSWPAPASQNTTFDLAQGGGMQEASTCRPKTRTGTDSYTVTPGGLSGTLTYTTPPLQGSRRVITGPTEVTLNTAFSAWDGDIIANLAEVAPNGTVTPISGPPEVLTDIHGYLKASHRDSDSDPLPVVPGKLYTLHLQLPSQYWQIAPGDQLRLVITSTDTNVAHDAPAGTVSIASGCGTGSTMQISLADATS